MSTIAVLTGDLIGSTEAGPEATDRAMQVLSETAQEIAAWHLTERVAVGNTYFTRHRGDGWQIYVSVAHFGLRAALFAYARLAGHPGLPTTRIAIGEGSVDRLPGPDLSNAHGAAFAVSGRALSEMERGERLRLAGFRADRLTRATIGLLEDRITGWTAEQAEAMALVLSPQAPTQSAVAATLGISPQALSYRLAGAKWPSIRRFLNAWEDPQRPDGRPA
ncbi:MAG: hypothetical protein KDE03_17460 [Rhodobacteraceae bacterium]|nr:hypothetical protein [Paracoccaceae bacterium]